MTERYALAAGMVYLGPAAFELVKQNKMKKGDVLTVAQLAGASVVSIICNPRQLWPASTTCCSFASALPQILVPCQFLIKFTHQEVLYAVTHLEADLDKSIPLCECMCVRTMIQ